MLTTVFNHDIEAGLFYLILPKKTLLTVLSEMVYTVMVEAAINMQSILRQQQLKYLCSFSRRQQRWWYLGNEHYHRLPAPPAEVCCIVSSVSTDVT